MFDEHVNRVSDIIERLQKLEDLAATTEPVKFKALLIIRKMPSDR